MEESPVIYLVWIYEISVLVTGGGFFLSKKNAEEVCDENRNLLRRGIGYVSMNKNKGGFLPKPV